jgi:putative tryptophan/tyrosine transport system substrate-binding protein
MRRRRFVVLAGAAAVQWLIPVAGNGQHAPRPRIGFLWSGGRGYQLEIIEAALAEDGYVDGGTAVFERRFAEGRFDRLPALAKELIEAHVDVIVAQTTAAALAAKRLTATIPIVFTSSGDAVGSGLVESLARPGGNLTGNSFMGSEFAAKQVQLLKEAVPGAARIAFFANRSMPPERIFFERMKTAAIDVGVVVEFVDARRPDDFERAAAELSARRMDAVIVAPGGYTEPERLRRAIEGQGLPSLYFWREYVEEGGLMAYGPSLPELFRTSARYVDRILRGAHPGDLPVGQPTRFDLVINAGTARRLGLSLSPALLARADEVIE